MKHTSKHNDGFTLIELVVAMAVAVIVTAAATSVLLFGLRVNRQSADTASRQMTVRALLNVVEKAAADGNIMDIQSDYASWELLDRVIDKNSPTSSYRVIFGFNPETQAIYTGKVVSEGKVDNEGTTVLEGVYASNVTIENNLLSISVETKDGLFSSSIYCRIATLQDDATSDELPDGSVDGVRGEFIKILRSQYRSRGEIRNGDGKYTYYSEWYIGADYDDNVDDNGWNAKTPWCACYVSWALSQISNQIDNLPEDRVRDINVVDENLGEEVTIPEYYWFANVDEFMRYFTKTPDGKTETWLPGGKEPTPGDLIFFDWDKGNNPEHVGVVLEVKNNGGATIIYTIEGNSSGRVAIRSYSINDPRIIGYGVLF